MKKIKLKFRDILRECEKKVKDLGIEIKYTEGLDPFFKGDLDGKTIFISSNLSSKEKLFNLLHLAGHTIQWNVDPSLRELGSTIVNKPKRKLLRELQEYEWEANCYGLQILNSAGFGSLKQWLTILYTYDMIYLTHFYITGKKLKKSNPGIQKYLLTKKLEPKEIPNFTPVGTPRTRNGLVIVF